MESIHYSSVTCLHYTIMMATDKGQVCRGLFIGRFSHDIKMLAGSFEDCGKKM